MHYFAIGSIIACTALLIFPELPHISWLGLFFVGMFLIGRNIYLNAKQGPNSGSYPGSYPGSKHSTITDCSVRLCIGLSLGFSWALFSAHHSLSDRLPHTLEGIDLIVTGNVAGIPQRGDTSSRFEFNLETADHILPDTATDSLNKKLRQLLKSTTVTQFQSNRRLRLTWYRNAPELISGDRWQLQVRLKRPNGLMNPAAFDYEGWLFRHGIDAVGYVRKSKNNQSLPPRIDEQRPSLGNPWGIDRIRQNLVTKMTQSLNSADSGGLVIALVIGDRAGISSNQWQTLRETGTSHLMAISGLHIGLVAGFVFFLLRWAWAFVPFLVLHVPAQKAAAIFAILAAFIYAGLAGFSIPTQRAFIMVTIAMLSLVFQRRFQAGQYLSYAVIGVLIVDPLAPMDPGFWLSFVAVAVLMLGMSHRLGITSLWWRWGRAQWVIFLGLLPIVIFYFGALPVSAPLANIVAIPWVTFLTVPLSLIATALLTFSSEGGGYVLQWAATTLDILWPVLEGIQTLIPVYSVNSNVSIWVVVAAISGCMLLLLPQGIPGRWLGLIWILPIFWSNSPKLSLGEISLTVLDVGQGLSVVVETRHHVMIYDTGAKFSQRFDSASAALLPFLRYRNLNKVDTLVLSHDDIDHVGSADTLLAGIAVDQIVSSYTSDVTQSDITQSKRVACVRGQTWSWDKVLFEVLHPPASIYPGMDKDNNQSCVIRISANGGRVLLTGDIESVIENMLVNENADTALLNAELLLVPHHGSASSSTEAFIDQVGPRIAVASTGYRNRYRFPKPYVVERYLQRGIEFVTTAEKGAMTYIVGNKSINETFDNDAKGQKMSIYLKHAMRVDHKRFWYSR